MIRPGTWAAIALACAACTAPLPQMVVVVDTDAPVVDQLAGDATLSPAAALDTLRVEVLTADLQPIDRRDFVAPDPAQWPISFGIAVPAGGTVLVRVRAFRARLAVPGTIEGVSTLEPRPEVTIDRAVELALPSEGVRTVEVVLATDCLGIAPTFLPPRTTCVDGTRLHAAPTEGVESETATTTRVGTWPFAREVPCTGTPREGARCIPGGFSILGSADLPTGNLDLTIDLLPLRPVRLSPFWMDTTEMTVGRYRALLAQHPTLPLPTARNTAGFQYSETCTFIDASDAHDDALPLNCIGWDAARAACQAAGGDLPREAQWEHAARGRGQSRRYPWGDGEPECCTAALERQQGNLFGFCGGDGLEPAGSHTGGDGCPTADVSRDGVVDLAGSLEEMQLDAFACYGDRCWAHDGVPLDPLCAEAEGLPSGDRRCPGKSRQHMQRGGYWNAGGASALSALRSSVDGAKAPAGFRCVYADGAP